MQAFTVTYSKINDRGELASSDYIYVTVDNYENLAASDRHDALVSAIKNYFYRHYTYSISYIVTSIVKL